MNVFALENNEVNHPAGGIVMSTKSPSSKNILWIIAKVLIFMLCLYLAYLVLKPLLGIILSIGFWIIKVAVVVFISLLVLHLLLRIIFKIDLLEIIFGVRWPK